MYFELDDGEALHKEAPVTFYIPPREQRASLQPGQLVKLVFASSMTRQLTLNGCG